MFPNIPIPAVRFELERSGSVETTVERILREGRLPEVRGLPRRLSFRLGQSWRRHAQNSSMLILCALFTATSRLLCRPFRSPSPGSCRTDPCGHRLDPKHPRLAHHATRAAESSSIKLAG